MSVDTKVQIVTSPDEMLMSQVDIDRLGEAFSYRNILWMIIWIIVNCQKIPKIHFISNPIKLCVSVNANDLARHKGVMALIW